MNDRRNISAVVIILINVLFASVTGHGRLRIPPQRSSLWREGLSSRINTDDNQINCGGYAAHQIDNNGKCGVCGDIFNGVQNHQPPGKYAQGIIGRCYKPGTTWIDVKVEITANHLGYFQFNLCPNNNVSHPVTQACLDANPLEIRSANGAQNYGTKFYITNQMFDLNLQVLLPRGLQCSQCVIQWIYTTGNNWGCAGGKCGLGFGSQEMFINCADVAVMENCDAVVGRKQYEIRETVSTARRYSNENCVAVGIWARLNYNLITNWCRINCHDTCPPDYCRCW